MLERLVEQVQQERVHQRIGVAHPDGHDPHVDGYAVPDERVDRADQEERTPAEDEAAHDDTHRPGRLRLSRAEVVGASRAVHGSHLVQHFLGSPIDLPVENRHHQNGHEEARDAGAQSEASVHHQDADLVVGQHHDAVEYVPDANQVPVQHYRHEGHDEGQRPADGDESGDCLRLVPRFIERLADGQVPVYGQEDEIQNRSQAELNDEAVKHVAVPQTE